MRRALLLAATLVLAGCSADPIETARTGNPGVKAGLIAQIEGCNLYRVRDGDSRTVYVAVCPGGASRTSWSESCGKACARDLEALSLRRSSAEEGSR
jgi:hypothetical protein